MELPKCRIDFRGAFILICLFVGYTFVVVTMTSAETKVTCSGVCETTKDIYGVEGGGEEGGRRRKRGGGREGGRGGGERRAEKKAKVTVAVASTVEPNSFLMRQVSPTGDTYIGYLDDLLQEVSTMSNFRFQWLIVEENRKHVTKRDTITEQLTSEKANIGVLTLNSTPENDTQGLVYSRPFLTTSLSLLHKTPPASDLDRRPVQINDLLLAARNSRGSRTKFGVLNEALAARIKASNSSLYRQMWGHKSPAEVLFTQDEGLRRVREDDLFLVLESTDADYMTSSSESCDVTSSPQQTMAYVTSYTFAALENSSLVLAELDLALASLGSDFFGRLYAKWWAAEDVVCSESPERGEADDSLDQERIFFTSPVKFFRSSRRPPFDEVLTATSKTRPEEFHHVTTRNTRDTNRKRRRTTSGQVTMTSSSTTLLTQNRINRGDPYSTQNPLRSTKRHSKATTTTSSSSSSSSRRQKGSDFKHGNEALITVRSTTIDHVLQIDDTRRGYISQDTPNDNSNNNRQWNNNNNNNNQRSNSESRYHPTPRHTPKSTMTSRDQFVDNFDWFFITHEPRYPQEIDYEESEHNDDDNDDEDDDDDDTEQRAAYEESLDIEGVDHVTVRTVLERPWSSTSSANNRSDLQTKLIALNIFASIFAVKRFRFTS